MSVVVTHAAVSVDLRMLSDIELAIKLNQDARLALAHQAQEAMGDPQLLLMYHQQDVQLEQEYHKLQMEYEALKAKIEEDKKREKDAIGRGFKSTI